MNIDDALKAIENDSNIKFRDLLQVCKNFFEGPRIEGSHHIFKTPWQGKPWLNLQKDKKMAKKYQVKQVREALKKLKEEIGEKNEKIK
ncbi:MAG: hypothetical protein A2381_05510 [Bdellovibrionales bacterium RIFOXYB1_FULL_37_110]|nr:MAG: hypothetical protein A2381_05510 [Bdellovibrionales bacterium RIFOXYB1_FULL_37_110]